MACLANSDCPTGFKAHVIRKKVPDAEISWLCVVTSTKITEEVVAILLRLAFKYNLVLMDRQNGCKAWRKEDLFKTCSVIAENRKSEINELLYNRKLMIFSLRQVESHFRNFSHNISYVMTLRYVQEKTLEERIREIYETIVDALVEGERVCSVSISVLQYAGVTIRLPIALKLTKMPTEFFIMKKVGHRLLP